MSGPSETHFGDVVSSSLAFGEPPMAHQDLLQNFKLFKGQIQQIYAVDATGNSPTGGIGIDARYDVAVYRSDGSLEIIARCTMLQPGFGGGINNFLEVLGPNPGPTSADPTVSPQGKPGQFVLVGLMEGSKQGGVILGCLPHTNPTAVATRPTEDEGTVLQGEFQGLNWKIDNDGALTVVFNGPRDDSGMVVNPDVGPTTLMIDQAGKVLVTTNNEQTIEVDPDPDTQTVTVTCGPTTFVMDGQNDKITQMASTVETLGSDTNRVQGGNILLSKSPDSSPSEPFVLGNVFTNFCTQLLTAIQTHTHIGNLGVPTPPPINMADFMQLAQSPIGDNSILSDFITGEKG